MVNTNYKKFFNIDSLIKDVKKYLPDFNKKLFIKAFDFAEKAHKGQFRKDEKTPYIVHPVEVMEILSTLHADQTILIAALLHDVPENTKYDLEVIKSQFGEEVTFLVEGITKLSKVHYKYDMPERQIESLKKLFLHSSKDPRVILIKLADRLQNMRTLNNIEKPEKRLRIARETLEIFVPIANLLGLQKMKSELEDLCFMHLFYAEYKKLSKIVEKKQQENEEKINKFTEILREGLKKNNIPAEILIKRQNLYTIYSKLCAGGKLLNDYIDKVIIRIIVKDIPKCYEALGVVHSLFTPKTGKFKDYIATPKINKYRSLHTMVFGAEGILTEIQIRTEEMHLEAKYGIAASSEMLYADVRSSWVNKILELSETDKFSDNFLENLKGDIFKDRISIFTPKGGKIDLPEGSSAIDFAYAIHTEIGNHASKARINGDIVPISAPLKTGDTVDIITDVNASPKIAWLPFSKTNLAKNKIRFYLRQEDKNIKIKTGRKLLQREFDIGGLGLVEKMSFKRIKKSLMNILGKSFQNLEHLLTSVAEGDIKPMDVVKALIKSKRIDEKIRINVKIVAKNRFGLLADISKVFYKHAIDLTSIKAWTSNKNEDADFNVQVLVRNIDDIAHIFEELEEIDDVKYVYRIPYKALYMAYILFFLLGAAWIFHPFILRIFIWSHWIEANSIFANLVIFGWMFLMFIIITFITYVAKHYLPFFRHKKLTWIVAFTMPILVACTLIADFFYFGLQFSWIGLFIELLLIYFYLILSYLNLKGKY